MTKETILKLFKNFVGGVVNLNGLQCIPVEIRELTARRTSLKEIYTIDFKIENPNDVPYFYSIVDEELYEIVQEFSDYINFNIESNVIFGDNPSFYLNREVRDRIQKVFDSVKEIKFTLGTPFIGYRRYVIKIESVGMLKSDYDIDSFSILNRAVPTSATKNGENIDIETALKEYDIFLKDKDNGYESEEYYIGVDHIIKDYPLLYDHHVATYYFTKFIQ